MVLRMDAFFTNEEADRYIIVVMKRGHWSEKHSDTEMKVVV